MKGIVFNLLEEVVTRHHGAATWDSLLEAAELNGSYTSLGNYGDAEMMGLVGAASRALGISGSEVLQWFGRMAMPVLAQRYPAFFSAHRLTRPFLVSLNSIIHPEVRKIYPGADVPHFDFSEGPGDSLMMGYRSARKLCALAHGFIEGAGAHYGETVGFEQPQCMHRGDSKCLFHLTFAQGIAARA